MSNELIAILAVGVALAGLMLTQIRNLRTDLRVEIREVKQDVGGLRKDVGALNEHMAHLEGLVEALKEVVVARIAA